MNNIIQQQVSYRSFFKRVMSTMMDMLIISTVFSPITGKISDWLFLNKFGDILREKDVDLSDKRAVMELMMTPEMSPYRDISAVLDIFIPSIILYIVCIGTYFIGSWYYFGCTPIKYLMSMKIVDDKTLEKPKLINLIWRFLGCGFFIFGIWWMFFTGRRQALHDKLGHTVVVKA